VGPDRLSVFNYAHLPERFKPQRRINEKELPSPQQKLDILKMTIDHLGEAGYVYIGMDHFARPNDELSVAQREGTLYRNFQGYSTHSDCDLVAMGVTSISMVGSSYSQNVRDLEAYYERIDSGRLPVFRGVELTQDDLIRRDVITQLICNFHLDLSTAEKTWDIRFDEYFADEQARLRDLAGDGLIAMDDRRIQVLPRGRLLIRNVCMIFDRYLPPVTQQKNFSRVI